MTQRLHRYVLLTYLTLGSSLLAGAAPPSAAPPGGGPAREESMTQPVPAETGREATEELESSDSLWDLLKDIFGDDTNTQSGGGKPAVLRLNLGEWRVLSPLKGKHVQPPAQVRWMRVAGAQAYRLTLKQGDATLWSQTVEGQQPATPDPTHPGSDAEALSVPLPPDVWRQVAPGASLSLRVEVLVQSEGKLIPLVEVSIRFELLTADAWHSWQVKAEQEARRGCPGPVDACGIPCEGIRRTLVFGQAMEDGLFTEAERMAEGGLPWCGHPAQRSRTRGRVPPTIW